MGDLHAQSAADVVSSSNAVFLWASQDHPKGDDGSGRSFISFVNARLFDVVETRKLVMYLSTLLELTGNIHTIRRCLAQLMKGPESNEMGGGKEEECVVSSTRMDRADGSATI
ncbi:hypothetical protein V2G26_016419 [Clonostachys chloroleuca]